MFTKTKTPDYYRVYIRGKKPCQRAMFKCHNVRSNNEYGFKDTGKGRDDLIVFSAHPLC